MAYALIRPILDNRTAFKAAWPRALYGGDYGDAAHQQGNGDHTSHSDDEIFGKKMLAGYVYAQDFNDGDGFSQAGFTIWLLTALRAGKYPEVKYVISRHPANATYGGGLYFGLFDRRYGWRRQTSTGHTEHIHISYMPGYEDTHSTLMADYQRIIAQEEPDVSVESELKALNDFLQTGHRYGKTATAPDPELGSAYIGTLLRLLQQIDKHVKDGNEILAKLLARQG